MKEKGGEVLNEVLAFIENQVEPDILVGCFNALTMIIDLRVGILCSIFFLMSIEEWLQLLQKENVIRNCFKHFESSRNLPVLRTLLRLLTRMATTNGADEIKFPTNFKIRSIRVHFEEMSTRDRRYVGI